MFKVFLKLTVIISILEDTGLWSEGFAEQRIVQVVAGTVRCSVRVPGIAEWNFITEWRDSPSKTGRESCIRGHKLSPLIGVTSREELSGQGWAI